MNSDDLKRLLKQLLDENEVPTEVSNRDLRWLFLMQHREQLSSLEALGKSVDALRESLVKQEGEVDALVSDTQSIMGTLGEVKRVQNDCPMSSREKENRFLERVGNVAKAAAKEANGTKPVLGPLNRSEAISVLGWVAMALVVALVYLATNGGVQLPLP